MIKFVKNKDNKILCKKDNKIVAFIFEDKNGFNYAFGKPSQTGGYISFYGNKNPLSLEEAKNRILEHI